MYCDQCGRELAAGAKFCSGCGREVSKIPALAAGRVEKHLGLLAVLWVVYSVYRLLTAVWLVMMRRVFVPFILAKVPNLPADFPLGRMVSSFMSFAAAMSVVGALSALVAAWALHQKESWGRVLGIVIGVLALINFPFGTALGLLTLWVLLPGSSEQEYQRLARAT